MNFDALTTFDYLVWEEMLLFVAALLSWICFLVVWGFKTPQVTHAVRATFQLGFAVYVTRGYFLRTMEYPRSWWTNGMIIFVVVCMLALLWCLVRESGLLGRRRVRVEDVP